MHVCKKLRAHTAYDQWTRTGWFPRNLSRKWWKRLCFPPWRFGRPLAGGWLWPFQLGLPDLVRNNRHNSSTSAHPPKARNVQNSWLLRLPIENLWLNETYEVPTWFVVILLAKMIRAILFDASKSTVYNDRTDRCLLLPTAWEGNVFRNICLFTGERGFGSPPPPSRQIWGWADSLSTRPPSRQTPPGTDI